MVTIQKPTTSFLKDAIWKVLITKTSMAQAWRINKSKEKKNIQVPLSWNDPVREIPIVCFDIIVSREKRKGARDSTMQGHLQ